jgi:hypothetical protein
MNPVLHALLSRRLSPSRRRHYHRAVFIQRAAVLASILLSLTAQLQLNAATVTWINPATGNWIDGPNWDAGSPPNSATGDVALINNGGTATINPADFISTGSLTLGSVAATSGTVVMNGGSLTTTTTDIRIGGNSLTVAGGTGRLDQFGGDIILNAGNVNVGIGPSSVGTYNLNGGSLTVNSAAIMAIGNRGTGTVNQSGGILFVRSQANPLNGLLELGRNTASIPGFGTFTLSGGTAAANLFRFGEAAQTSGAQSVNTLNLQGTGTLLTGTMSINNPAANNTFNFIGGSLTGRTISLSITNNGGTLRPASLFFGDALTPPPLTIDGVITDPIGMTTFTGNSSYTQTLLGTLAIEIGALGNDFVDIGQTGSGGASLGGTIALSLLNGFDPGLGATFNILTADTITSNAILTGSTPSGRTFAPMIVTGGDGRQVLQAVVVPEPASLVFAAAASLWIMVRRRRAL